MRRDLAASPRPLALGRARLQLRSPVRRQYGSDQGLPCLLICEPVAVIEVERAALPPTVLLHYFTLAQLQHYLQEVEVGSSLLVVGFPLGFHDTLHHLPVARQAVIASSFGLRFQAQATFSPMRACTAAPAAQRW